jgi:hypothetical protein
MPIQSDQESSGRLCSCGVLAIGACASCEAWICGEHGELVEDRFLCRTHATAQKAELRREAVAERQATERRAEDLRQDYIELLDELLDRFRRFMSKQRGSEFQPHRVYSLRDRRWRKSKGSVQVLHGKGWVIASVGRGSMLSTTYWLATDGTVLEQEASASVPKHHVGSAGSVVFEAGPDNLCGIGSFWQEAAAAESAARRAGYLLQHPDTASRAAIEAAYESFRASIEALRCQSSAEAESKSS